MDRAEKVGLGAAIAGHALLLALLIFGVLQSVRPIGSDGGGGGGDGVAVEIVSESAPSSPTPTEAVVEETPDVQEQPEIIPEPVASILPAPKLVQKIAPKPQPQVAKKTPAKPGPVSKGNGSSTYKQQMEKMLGGIGAQGKDKGKGKAEGPGTSNKSAGQVKSEVNVSLLNEVRPFWNKCRSRLNGLDIELILTTLALNIAPDGRLNSVSFVRQSGVNDSNRPQASLHRECAVNAVRAAAPFSNLPKDNYDIWKRWEMDFKRNVS